MKPQLPYPLQEELLQNFCEALLCLHTTQEALQFLTDLLTKQETTTLAKRIQIAKLLLEGKEYRAIEEKLRVSHGTIAKVAAWLTDSGEGFRLITERAPKQQTEKQLPIEPLGWANLKRRYPVMFWPQLLMEDIVRNAKKKERERIQKAIEKLDHKSKLYRQLNRILVSSGRKIRKNSTAM